MLFVQREKSAGYSYPRVGNDREFLTLRNLLGNGPEPRRSILQPWPSVGRQASLLLSCAGSCNAACNSLSLFHRCPEQRSPLGRSKLHDKQHPRSASEPRAGVPPLPT